VCEDCATDEEDEMDALERLLAIKEIEDVITRYCFTFDDQDWDAFAKLWTEDAAFVAAGVAFEGRETMLDFLTTCLPDDYTSKHMCSRSLIELDPDGTTARAKTDVVWIAANFENTIVARYDDTLVLQDGSCFNAAWRLPFSTNLAHRRCPRRRRRSATPRCANSVSSARAVRAPRARCSPTFRSRSAGTSRAARCRLP
jgi:hypothetical protein